jgi:hypothetical protein
MHQSSLRMLFGPRHRSSLALFGLLTALIASAVRAADLHVEPDTGDDTANGVSQPVRTIARAIRLASPGDTIHLQPKTYRDWAPFFDKAGEPGRPITLDGHGAVLEGCDPLTPEGWVDLGHGLFRHDDLLPLTEAIVDRWFFLRPDGSLNRMQRCSKGPSEPLKSPDALGPGEWTFVKDAERTKTARAGYIVGSFFLRLAEGESLANCGLSIPYRTAGVLIRGQSRHLVVKNVTARHPYNDGFNLSDCVDVRFENIRAEDCGDDGISAHGACRYTVDGFTSVGNATGICDTGSSETSYRNVRIERCVGFDLYFLDTGRYAVRDAVIRSLSARPLYLMGRDVPAEPCRLTLENVLLERVATAPAAEVRVSPNCRLELRRCTILGLDWQATGGTLVLEQSILGGTVAGASPRPATLHLWPGARWEANGNVYAFGSARVDQATFTAKSFDGFRSAVAREESSRWLVDTQSLATELEAGSVGATAR